MDGVNWVTQLLASGLRLSLPMAFAALGGCISELSGITAMGLEGMMISGAFFSVVGSYFTGNAFVGIAFGILGGIAMACVQALFCIRYQANQIVCGLGINMLGSGLTIVLLSAIFGSKGQSAAVASFETVTVPVLSKIPILGALFSNDIFFYIFLLLLVTIWLIIYKTPTGLRLRAAGVHPEALDSLGIDVIRIRYLSVLTCGVLCGFAGASLSIGQMSFFSPDMTAGKGYIAIAAFVFGGWNPVFSTLVALLFGVMEALQLRLQTYVTYPQMIQMIPYLVTIVMVSINLARRESPAAIGKPYYYKSRRRKYYEN